MAMTNTFDVMEYFRITLIGWRRMSAVRQTELIERYKRSEILAKVAR